MPRKPGQEPKYDKNFHPQDFIVQSMQGKNLTQIGLSWKIHKSTIYRWDKKYTEMRDALKKGKFFCEGWWVNLGQAAVLGEVKMQGKNIKINVTMFVWMTKNLFNWGDNQNVKNSSKETVRVIVEDYKKKQLEQVD